MSLIYFISLGSNFMQVSLNFFGKACKESVAQISVNRIAMAFARFKESNKTNFIALAALEQELWLTLGRPFF